MSINLPVKPLPAILFGLLPNNQPACLSKHTKKRTKVIIFCDSSKHHSSFLAHKRQNSPILTISGKKVGRQVRKTMSPDCNYNADLSAVVIFLAVFDYDAFVIVVYRHAHQVIHLAVTLGRCDNIIYAGWLDNLNFGDCHTVSGDHKLDV